MHAAQFTPWHGQVTRNFRAAAQKHCIEFFFQLLGADGFFSPIGDLAVFGPVAHQHAGFEDHALGLHLLDTAIDVAFFHFEIGDAIAQQAAHTVVFLEHGDRMADTRQLLRRRQSRRTRTDDSHFLACFLGRRLGLDPALRPTPVDDGVLNRLDTHRVAIEIDHASGLARSGANATGEFGEVVRAVQHGQSVLPVVVEHQVVEVGDDVVDRAATVAKRRTAVHATRALRLGLLGAQANDELFVVLQALGHGLVALFDALKLHEPSDFSHDLVLFFQYSNGRVFAHINFYAIANGLLSNT